MALAGTSRWTFEYYRTAQPSRCTRLRERALLPIGHQWSGASERWSFSEIRSAMAFLKILIVTVCGLIVGTAGFSVAMDWPNTEAMLSSVLFSPVLALAGWFLVFLIFPLVAMMWGIRAKGIVRPTWLFVLVGGLVGAVVGVAIMGGADLKSRVAFIIGACLAGAVSNGMIVALRRTMLNEPLQSTAATRPG